MEDQFTNTILKFNVILQNNPISIQWRSQDFGSGGDTLGGQPRGGSGGGGAPGRRRIFENFQKISLENC